MEKSVKLGEYERIPVSGLLNIKKSLNYPSDLHVLVEKQILHAHFAFGSANRRITLPCLKVPVSLGPIYTGP